MYDQEKGMCYHSMFERMNVPLQWDSYGSGFLKKSTQKNILYQTVIGDLYGNMKKLSFKIFFFFTRNYITETLLSWSNVHARHLYVCFRIWGISVCCVNVDIVLHVQHSWKEIPEGQVSFRCLHLCGSEQSK